MARSPCSGVGVCRHLGRRPRFGMTVLAITALLMQLGCGAEEPIRHYKVLKPEVLYELNHVDASSLTDTVPTVAGEPTDRLLGAIVPHGSQTWYFKMTGPMTLVAQQETAFRGLIASLKFDSADAVPRWTLPDSWQENEGSGRRLATLSVEVEGKKLETTIIQLATSPAPSAILDNVNRWRSLMGLAPISVGQMQQETTKLELGDGSATLVNLVGNFSSGPMATASATGGRPTSSPQTSATRVQYDKPDAWSEDSPATFSVATFRASKGDASVRITVSPLKGDGGGLLANVNRWLGQADLPTVKQQDLAKRTEQIDVNGISGTYVEAIADEGQAQKQAIVGWIGFQSGQSWFVKMQGDPKLARDQCEAFRKFLKTLKF